MAHRRHLRIILLVYLAILSACQAREATVTPTGKAIVISSSLPAASTPIIRPTDLPESPAAPPSLAIKATLTLTMTPSSSPTLTPIPPTTTPDHTQSDSIITNDEPIPDNTPIPTSLSLEPTGPQIVNFAVEGQDEGLALSWKAIGKYAAICPLIDQITIGCRCLIDIPLAGSTVIEADQIIGNYTEFELTVVEGENSTTQTIPTAVRCQNHNEWFFEDPPGICPAGSPEYTPAAAQEFQRGWMVWLESSDTYYIFYETDLQLERSGQGWSSLTSFETIEGPLSIKPGADPDNRVEEEPPPGLLEPLSGFGLVWRGEVQGAEGVRERIGWARQTEFGFNAIQQCQSSCGSSWDCYLSSLYGGVLHLYYLTHFGFYWNVQ